MVAERKEKKSLQDLTMQSFVFTSYSLDMLWPIWLKANISMIRHILQTGHNLNISQ